MKSNVKIYDCFIFSNEIELLDLRIKELDPYVDVFVLLESPWSFHGKPKELLFEKNKHLFNNKKIRHIVYEDLPYIGNVNGNKRRSKMNERFSRDCSIRGLYDAKDEDIIMLSDVDEIPNMETVINSLSMLDDENIPKLKYPEFPCIGLYMPMFFYYINNLSDFPYTTTIISKYKHYVKFKNPSWLRKKRMGAIKGTGGPNLIKENCGWHYTYLGGIDGIQRKLSTLGSIDICTEEFKNKDYIEKCIREGKDIAKRKDIKLEIIDPLKNGPKEIGWFMKKYPHMIKEL